MYEGYTVLEVENQDDEKSPTSEFTWLHSHVICKSGQITRGDRFIQHLESHCVLLFSIYKEKEKNSRFKAYIS